MYYAFNQYTFSLIHFQVRFFSPKRRMNVNLVDLVKCFPTNIYFQKSASIQPRTSPSKFGGKFNSLFICLFRQDPVEIRLPLAVDHYELPRESRRAAHDRSEGHVHAAEEQQAGPVPDALLPLVQLPVDQAENHREEKCGDVLHGNRSLIPHELSPSPYHEKPKRNAERDGARPR